MFRKFVNSLMIALMLAQTAPSFAQQTQKTAARGEREEETSGDEASLLEPLPRELTARGLDAPVDPDTYVIGPSDEFVLILRGQAEEQFRLRVLPEGSVLLPNIGALEVAGMTITEFRARLDKELDRYYKNVVFDCRLVQPRAFVVYVLGDVKSPGGVELHAPFRLSSAIESVGGIIDRGSKRNIEIREEGRTVRNVDLSSFLLLGNTDENPVLKEGQSVYVPSRGKSVTIWGEVWRGGIFEVLAGETVADLLRLAGGLTSHADTGRMRVERYDDEGQVSVNRVSYDEAGSFELQDLDIILVPDRRSFFDEGFVVVIGGGGRDGRMTIAAGETLGSFLPRFIRFRDDQDLTRAVIERQRDDGSREYIDVNLRDVLNGKEVASLPLRSGDVISIPPEDKAVYVTGEVVEPGPVDFQRGLSAERYIALAGGPTEAGSLNKLEIYSSDGTKRHGNRSSVVYRGDTILVKRRTSKTFGAIFVSLTSLTSLILSIVAVSRTN